MMADDKRPPTKNEMSRAEREAALWDDDIKLFKDEVAQQRSLPYVWAQDIRHLEIDFNVPWFIKRDDIRTEWTKYSIKCGVDTPAGFSTILEGGFKRMIDVDKCVANIHRTDTGDYNVRLILTKAIPEYWAHVVTHAPKAKLWKQRLEHLEQVDMKSGAPPASNVTTKERKVSTITSPPQDSWEDKLVKKIIKLDKRIDASLNKVTPYAPQPCIRHWWVYKCKHAAYVDEECYPHSLHIRNSLLSKCETVDITHNSDALCNYCAVEVSRKYCRDMRSLRQEDLFFEVLTTSRYTYFDMIASRDFEYVASFVAAAAWDKYAAENPIPDESASWKDYSDLVALKVKVTTDAVAEARNHRSALAKGRFDKKWMGEVTTVRPAPNDGPTIDEEDIIYDSDACEEIAEEVGGQGLSMGYRDMLYGDVRTLRQIETVHQAMKVINETYDPNRLDNSEEEDTSTTTECENPSVQIAVSEEENDVIPTNDLGLAIQVTAAEENAELPPRTCVSPTPSDDDWATTVFHSPTRRELQGISLDQNPQTPPNNPATQPTVKSSTPKQVDYETQTAKMNSPMKDKTLQKKTSKIRMADGTLVTLPAQAPIPVPKELGLVNREGITTFPRLPAKDTVARDLEEQLDTAFQFGGPEKPLNEAEHMARLSKMYGETKVSSGAVASKEEGRRSHFQEAIVEENEVKAASKGKLADQLEKVKAFFKKLFRRKEEKKAEPTVVISAYSKGKVKAKAVVTSEAPPVDEFGVPMI